MHTNLLKIYILFFCFLSIATIEVISVEELHKALERAKSGQVILIAPGIYDVTSYERKDEFKLSASGTKSSPITLAAKDPDDPPILRASSIKEGTMLHITGSYWIVDNIKIAYCGRGILMEHSSYSIIRNVEIYSIGSTAIIVRDGSSHNLFQNCYIHDTGRNNDLFGNAFVIGNAIETTYYDYKNDYNVIDQCVFSHISSVNIGIRVFCTGNEIVNSVFYGDSINGKYNGVESSNHFISITGSENYIHDNVLYRNLNKNIIGAFEIIKIAEETGDGNKFVNNVLFMDRPDAETRTKQRMYVVDGLNTTFSVKNNKVDYGEGLIDADNKEFYNSDSVTFLE